VLQNCFTQEAIVEASHHDICARCAWLAQTDVCKVSGITYAAIAETAQLRYEALLFTLANHQTHEESTAHDTAPDGDVQALNPAIATIAAFMTVISLALLAWVGVSWYHGGVLTALCNKRRARRQHLAAKDTHIGLSNLSIASPEHHDGDWPQEEEEEAFDTISGPDA